MIKKVLSICAVLMFALSMSAQSLHFEKLKSGNVSLKKSLKGNLKSTLTLEDNEMWIGYWDGDPNSQLTQLGTQTVPGTYIAAVKYPAGDAAVKGATVKGIKFTFPALTYIDNVRIFMSTKPISKATDADICCQPIDKSKLTSLVYTGDEFCELRFANPYVVDSSKDLFVGYDFAVTGGNSDAEQFPIVLVESDAVPNSIELGFGGNDLADYSQNGFGILALQVLISGNLSENSVAFDGSLRDVNAAKGEKVSIPVNFVNKGTNDCSSIKLRTTINGNSVDSIYTFETPVAAKNTKFSVDVSLTAPETIGTYEYSVKVLQVNGVDITDNTSNSGFLSVLSRNVKQKVFIEIFTGFWCGWCPRCNVAGEKLKQVYGDDVVVAMVHDVDELKCDDYAPINNIITGYPAAFVNREGKTIDPYYAETEEEFAILDYVKDKMNEMPVVEVIPSVKFNADSTDVTVDAKINFLFDGVVEYGVAYILIENKLSDNTWMQDNNYSKDANGGYNYLLDVDPLWEPWINGKSKVSGNENNYIVQAAHNINLSGLFKTYVTADEAVTDSHVFNLTEYPNIRNIKNMEAIVIVCEESTGKILNAGSVRFDGEDSAVEIIQNDLADDDAVEIARYTIDGRLITTPEKGINIVKYSNGKVRKVIVR